MIWSVSTLERRSGTPIPVCDENFSMVPSSGVHEIGGRGQGAAERGRGGGGGRDQVGAPALALPALEVAVGGRGGALAGGQLVGVHPEAHGAPRVAPLGPEVREHHVQAFGLG